MTSEEPTDAMRYCRILGHHVPFSYCLEPGAPRFCRHIVNCWFERFDIEGYLGEHFSEQEIAEATSPPAPKLESLVSLIDRARSGVDR